MCGLAGSFSVNSDLFPAEIEKSIRAVSHRGPDGVSISGLRDGYFQAIDMDARLEDFYFPRKALLGHARLAIIDLDKRSNQPMSSQDRRYSIVFNGEIYNYIELRNELKNLGSTFLTDGDTEVIMNAFKQWGVESFKKLRGMFAFILIDTKLFRAYAVRDRFGIKPLYYWKSPSGSFHLASEIKQFTCLSGWSAELDYEPALQFLLYGLTDHSAKSLFSGVTQVLPGTFVTIDFKEQLKIQIEKWWELDSGSRYTGTFDEAAAEFRERFLESVSLHLRSDVSVGSCLSGGLDSSAIVTAAHHCAENQNLTHLTFTASSQNYELDETRYAELVNKTIKAQGQFVTPDEIGLWKHLDEITWNQDEPFGSTSIYVQWEVFKLANKHGIKVMLDGQGADEQLGGYNNFVNWMIADQIRKGRLLKALSEFVSFMRNNRTNPLNLIQTLGYLSLPSPLIQFAGSKMGIVSQNAGNWISPEILKQVSPRDPFKSINKRPPSNVRELSHSMLTSTNLPMLLRFEDRNSMAFGIESRVPFLDHELVEFVTSLPIHYLVSKGNTKRILTKGLDQFIPTQIINRKDKIGFQTFNQQWITKNSDLILNEINEAIRTSRGLISKESIKLFEYFSESSLHNSQMIWRIVSFNRWLKVFQVKV